MKKMLTRLISWVETTAIILSLAFFVWVTASWIDVLIHTVYQPWNAFQIIVDVMLL
ncbi:MAG: hypothetical protein LUF92_14615 [Clostridiales bacterium]|nr:hypothetical protein [Clostridiales bacterium]